LAGIPRTLLARAREKLAELESGAHKSADYETLKEESEVQLSIFSKDTAEDAVSKKLRDLNLMELTPSEAIRILEELKGSIDD